MHFDTSFNYVKYIELKSSVWLILKSSYFKLSLYFADLACKCPLLNLSTDGMLQQPFSCRNAAVSCRHAAVSCRHAAVSMFSKWKVHQAQTNASFSSFFWIFSLISLFVLFVYHNYSIFIILLFIFFSLNFVFVQMKSLILYAYIIKIYAATYILSFYPIFILLLSISLCKINSC